MSSGFPIPVSVLTGFLGAGKTTLLNRLLKDPELADTAVIINEFGEVAIDHLLVEQASDGIIQLSDGCLCCTVRGDLVDTLADLVDRLQTGRIAKLARVVVETTGLADPAPVLQSIMAHPALLQAFRLDGVITLVDAVNGEATLDSHVEALKQAAVADRIVLTKTDLAEAAGIEALRARLRQINPGAVVLDVNQPGTGAAALFNCGLYDPRTKSADVRRWLGEEAAHDQDHCHDQDHHHDHDHHHHGGDHGHDHHHEHRHDARVRSHSLVHEGPVPFSSIEMFLDLLRSTHGEKLLRMKGVIELAEDPSRPLVIHGVQKILHPPARLPAWPDGQRGTRLVLITLDMPDDYIHRLFAAFTNKPSIDTPDRAALESNPLAIAGL
ncbi:GTP-binding protein [Mesorhizobium sp. M2D.F.Ca.ET.185.01.1.1]|uniref:CobW family GTP-binding protein n=1 Tax=unclassified Mesorhizobium TaxID=325217 RepID=UPI000FCC1FEB|nr:MULTISPECIES: GTP-binding protein [unclassified Mesorhizobium]TGP83304.1 GTP-binding protein [bacterium M00.F.Ca.ET.227.01.1.1]TGP99259.1 GTP-binding protein [bacterium M00.F.Ca.ET.221.01.1.1]TGP99989.1 GTP-binding protein [bacterium M00.F.Ca.ET.222.01.1.1]TGU11375.1 GTP-binding protein [bacterium M00.F.Ca.ET.163.01.1.1]TGU34971.1 GTP-binding protein [bacterium M00.F.Ca.ET.156.01.1.1]TGU51320.1 GTP-binding protein [bacterium M00.F.Ca.ET.146.01.1.1]TGV71387.1 GTP-binding protein [Mesorhizo